MGKIFFQNMNHFEGSKGFDLNRREMLIVGLEVIFFFLFFWWHGPSSRAWFPLTSFPLFSLVAPTDSSSFSYIFINQASSSTWLEEGEDMMPSLIVLTEKQHKTTTKDFSVVQGSNHREIYIDNFYTRKYVSHKKTEPGRCLRAPLDITTRQGGWSALVPSVHLGCLPVCFQFPIFLYCKTNGNFFCGFFWVHLLTISHTTSF